MKRIVICVLAAALSFLPALAMAGPKWKTLDEHLTWDPQAAFNSVATTTHSYVGYYAYGFSIYSTGADLKFTIHHTTRTVASGTTHVSSSTIFTVPDGTTLSYDFDLIVKDLRIVSHDFDTSATYYLYVDAGLSKKR